MTETIETLTPDASFEAVIAATQSLLGHMQDPAADPTQLQDDIVHLLKLDKGPRGFFASLLTDERSVADDAPAFLLNALQQVPEITAELLTKNLAMSSAMVVHHQRQQDESAIAGSQQVQQRCVKLIGLLKLDPLKQELNALVSSTQGSGAYTAFLQRWNYDEDQRAAIQQIVDECLVSF